MRLFALLASLIVAVAVTAFPAQAESPAQEAPLVARDARIAGDLARTRLVVDLSRTIEPTAFVLADPFRVVVDLPQTAFEMPAGVGREGRGLVEVFRFGLIGPGRSRIVLDLTGPAAIDRIFVLDPVEDQPARLVLDLVGTDEAAFREAAARRQTEASGGGIQTASVAVPTTPETRPLVVLDPGHGGIDSGALTASGDLEKAIVLEFARKLAAKIEQQGRYRVLMTRTDDTFIALGDRVRMARDNKAALFISIHADTLSDPFGVRGATVYTLSEKASDAEAERYAEKENRSDAIAGVDLAAEPDEVADILIDLTRRETKTFSGRFARILVDEFRNAATMNKNPMRSAGFRVLRAADVPSVLLELGYLSNAQDARLLTSEEWRDRASEAVNRAIDAFFAARADLAADVPPLEPLRGAN